MKFRRIVLYGPPGAGKTSIKRLMLDKPPLSKEEEQSTPIFEPPLRLITTDRLTSTGESNDLKVVENEELIQMIAKHLEKDLHNENILPQVVSKSTRQTPNQNPILSECGNKATTKNVDDDGKFHSPKRFTGTFLKKVGNHLIKANSFGVKSLYSVNWTHVIDSGGQPEFADLLPLVFPSEENLYFVVIPLDKKLTEKPNSQYMIDGENCIKSPEQLTLTYYQMIERMCQMAKLSNSSIKIIGTRLDCINEDTLKEKEEQINELKKRYNDVIILNADEDETAILALNAVEKDTSKRAEYIKKLKDITLNGETWCVNKSIPLSWIVLQLMMSRESRNGIISYSNVQKFATDLKIDDSNLSCALTFFSDLALNFYYPDVIKDIVLEKIDVVTLNISQFVKAIYEIPTNRPRSEQLTKFKQNGMFAKSILSKLGLKFEDEFSEEHFLDILEHLRIIHCIAGDEYFFPGILPFASPSDLPCIDSLHHPHPLLIFWEDAPLPHAFFSAVIVTLLRRSDISFSRGSRNRRTVVYLKYKTPTAVGVLLLVDRIHWMELYDNTLKANFQIVRTFVWSACEKVLDSLRLKPLKSTHIFGLYCPSHSQCNIPHKHPCTRMSPSTLQFQCHEEESCNWIEDNPERINWFSGMSLYIIVQWGFLHRAQLMMMVSRVYMQFCLWLKVWMLIM